jgi:putative transposase
MPRTARASAADVVYHVLNRGNNRAKVFRKPADYQAFLDLVGRACRRLPLRVLALCLMPNHFHLVLWPRADGDLSRWMQWLLTSHVRRYHRHYGGSGHVWQGRFKAFPIQRDRHLLIALRYVERNPLRAGLVRRRAADWPWSSAAMRSPGSHDAHTPRPPRPPRPPWLADGPVPLPDDWNALVDRPQTPAEENALRNSLARNAPFGAPAWQARTAARLGLESTLRPRGRPRIQKKPAAHKHRGPRLQGDLKK